MEVNWNEDKNKILQEKRGVSFEEIKIAIEEGLIIDILMNSNSKYDNQFLMIVNINNYAYVVPFIKNEKGFFLKTIFPSRKYTKIYNIS